MNKIFSTRLQGCVTRHDDKEKEEGKEEREKEKEGRNEDDTAICFFRQRGWLAFMLSIVECHWATDIEPIVYTHRGSL